VTSPAANSPRRGYPRSAHALIASMVAVLLCIAAVWGLTWFQRRGTADPTPTVDFHAALVEARRESPFHLVAPTPMPRGLRATSVNWDGIGPRYTWQLGMLNRGDQFVGLYQGNGPAAPFIAAHTPASQPGPPVLIDGLQWLRLSAPSRGETALVRTAGGVTVVVTGSAGLAEIEDVVRSLH
jgi:uncharacterized protein DUF4245